MRLGLRRFGGIGLAALAGAAVIAPVAQAAWSPPFDLSGGGQFASNPQLAVDDDGDAVFVWTRFDGSKHRIQARGRAAGGVLSPVQNLSVADEDDTVLQFPQVAVDAGGDAVFVWRRFDGANYRIQTRARSAAGALSAVQTVSPAGQDAVIPQVAVDGDGDAVFAWRRFDGTDFRIQARARSAAGALSAVQTLSAAGQSADLPDAAIDGDGDAVFTWRRFDGANERIQFRARSAAGALTDVRNLSPAGQTAGAAPKVAITPDGDAVFTWFSFDGANNRIHARERSAGGVLSPDQTLSGAGQHASHPQVAVEDEGDAVFTWLRSDGANDRVQARTRSAAGLLSPVETLSGSGQDASLPQVAADADGDAVFVWERLVLGDNRIQARTRSAAGTLGPVENLSDAGQDAKRPQVGVDSGGDAVATWVFGVAPDFQIQGAAGP